MCVPDPQAMAYAAHQRAKQAHAEACYQRAVHEAAARTQDQGNMIDGEYSVIEAPLQIEETKLLEHRSEE